jgi:hypothetical protein
MSNYAANFIGGLNTVLRN